jgi:hypothetical protein
MFVPGEVVIEPGSMAMNRGIIIKRIPPTPKPARDIIVKCIPETPRTRDIIKRIPEIPVSARAPIRHTASHVLYQSSYTKAEVESMDDHTIITCFQHVVLHGSSMLYCTHCGERKTGGKGKEIDPYWLESILTYCKKHGIIPGYVPKTCDERQRVNRQTNPISNAHYPKLRTAETTEEYGELITSRAIAIAQLGFAPSPTKYVM